LVFFTVYTSSGFIAGGKLFETIFNVPYIWAVVLGAGILIVYTFLGGFFAVCWTDFIQGVLMFFAALIVPVVTIVHTGGISGAVDRISAISPTFVSLFQSIKGNPLSAIVIISSLSWGLGYFGMPHILVRFMAIRKPGDLKYARRIAMVWVVISLFSAVFTGIIGHAFTASNPLADSEKIFMVIVQSLFISFIAGVMLSAILAAIMSTASSQLLVAASAISDDFYKALFRRKATQKELVWVSRSAVMAISLIAFAFALNPESSIFRVVSFAWAGLGSTFGPVILCALFWRRTTTKGALAGIAVGGITTLVWKLCAQYGGIFSLFEIVPGFFLSLVAIIVTSRIGAPPSKEITDRFDAVQRKMAEKD
jgi:sodium/proline symporter